MEAGRLVRRRVDASRTPLSFAQCEALRHLIEKREMTMRELAQSLGVAAPSATALAHELVRGGYLRRTGNPRDRRQVLLESTAKGRRAAADTLRSRAQVLSHLLGELSGRDHRDLQRIFIRIIETQ